MQDSKASTVWKTLAGLYAPPPHPLSHNSSRVCLLSLSRDTQFLRPFSSTWWKLSWEGSCPLGTLLEKRPQINLLISFNTILGCNIIYSRFPLFLKLNTPHCFRLHVLQILLDLHKGDCQQPQNKNLLNSLEMSFCMFLLNFCFRKMLRTRTRGSQFIY